jgi:hypothetical protein
MFYLMTMPRNGTSSSAVPKSATLFFSQLSAADQAVLLNRINLWAAQNPPNVPSNQTIESLTALIEADLVVLHARLSPAGWTALDTELARRKQHIKIYQVPSMDMGAKEKEKPMFKRLLFLMVLSVILASAQSYTLTFAVDASSDDTYVYNTVIMDYAPGQNCPMCSEASHTYTGTQVLQGDDGSYNSCSWNTGGPGTQSINTGCEVALPLPDINSGRAVTYTGYTTARNLCTVIGTFFSIFNAVVASPAKLYYTAYQETECTPGGLFWYCDVIDYGQGCPGTCSGKNSLQLSLGLGGKPLGYDQCRNVMIGGVCAGPCRTQSSAGFCSGVH